MPRRKSKKGERTLREVNSASDLNQTSETKLVAESPQERSTQLKCNLLEPSIKSGLERGDENKNPISSDIEGFNSNTAELYSELDSFRQKWKRELRETKASGLSCEINNPSINSNVENSPHEDGLKPGTSGVIKPECPKEGDISDENYAKAKKLFLTAVELEQDEMHYESIRYYKQAIHLCPDIEKQIFQEQRLASALTAATSQNVDDIKVPDGTDVLGRAKEFDSPLLDRIKQQHYQDNETSDYVLCRMNHKTKSGNLHFSDLPHELVVLIFRYVIGQELDLASLETVGLVCRGFFIISRDPILWRSICHRAWGGQMNWSSLDDTTGSSLDWRSIFLEKPRINYDGVYISRTRYIRQGDVGFQDLTYRPFHVVRYYRYLRFFPDGRVLILTTNEEPDKIVPIFRHALDRKQFSPELSILEGTYEFVTDNQISVVAEKDFRNLLTNSKHGRRSEQLYWARQTPQVQKFILKFKLDTMTTRPYRNNVLKWLEYTILSRFDTGHEVTSFDLTTDTFPSLYFARVRKFNLRLTNPLPIH